MAAAGQKVALSKLGEVGASWDEFGIRVEFTVAACFGSADECVGEAGV